MSKDNQIEIEVINYEQDRHYFFVDQVSLAQKKYDRLFKTFKDAPYASEGAQFLSDAGREVQFYKDIVEILDKGYRKASDVAEEIFEVIEDKLTDKIQYWMEKAEGIKGQYEAGYLYERISTIEDLFNLFGEIKEKYTEETK